MVLISDQRKIGTFVLFLGIFFLFLGVFLLFDKTLLAMGNFLFIFGFSMLSGARRTLEFFGLAGERWMERWRTRGRGIVTFVLGICLVCYGWTMIGMGIELFGFLNLFGSFFPLAVHFFRTLPYVGTLLNLPVISTIVDKIAGKRPSTLV